LPTIRDATAEVVVAVQTGTAAVVTEVAVVVVAAAAVLVVTEARHAEQTNAPHLVSASAFGL